MFVILIYPPLGSERLNQIRTYLANLRMNPSDVSQLKIILNRIQKDEFLSFFPELKAAGIDVHWYHPWHNFLDFRDYHRQLPRRLQTNDFILFASNRTKLKLQKLLKSGSFQK